MNVVGVTEKILIRISVLCLFLSMIYFTKKHGMKELMAYIYISLLFLLIHTCVLELRMLQSPFVHKCFNVFFSANKKYLVFYITEKQVTLCHCFLIYIDI